MSLGHGRDIPEQRCAHPSTANPRIVAVRIINRIISSIGPRVVPSM